MPDSLLPSPSRLLPGLALSLVLMLGLGALAILAAGDRYSRPVHGVVGAAPAALQARSVALVTHSGERVAGWFAAGRPRHGAVLLLHRKDADRRAMLGRARFLHGAGFAVLLIDMPAHGESSSTRGTLGWRESEAVRAAWAWLREHAPGERAGVIGDSLGAASLVYARLAPAPQAVVLEAMYPTIDEAIDNRMALRLGALAPWLKPVLKPLFMLNFPVLLGVSPSQLRPIDLLPALHAPLLVLGGDADQHTTPAETRRLFEAANEPKALWMVPGAPHVDLHGFDPRGYEARVLPFMVEHLQTARAGVAQDGETTRTTDSP